MTMGVGRRVRQQQMQVGSVDAEWEFWCGDGVRGHNNDEEEAKEDPRGRPSLLSSGNQDPSKHSITSLYSYSSTSTNV
jgi:hypothetical protein